MARDYDPLYDDQEVMRRLAVVEEIAHKYDDIEAKKQASEDAILALELHQLIGKVCMTDSSLVFAKRPNESPKKQLMFPNGFMFMAEVDNYGQQVDDEIPIDARTIQFVRPEVIGLGSSENEAFQALRFEIPFLAINSLVIASAV